MPSGVGGTASGDAAQALIPYLDPETYGRSPLENSSFIVSSAHSDSSLHGAGFVARLSGATAEFLSMWMHIMFGHQPFFVHDGLLHLALRPKLASRLFQDDGTLSCRFLGNCEVTYHNPSGVDIHREDIRPTRMTLQLGDRSRQDVFGDHLTEPHSLMVRGGQVNRIDVYY